MAKKTQEHKENISKGMEGNKNAEKYQGEKTDNTIYKLCLLGLTDVEIADILEISEATLNNWKNQYPSVLESIYKGKTIADAEVANSMYNKAVGYEVDDVKIFQFQGSEVIVPYIKKVEPDYQAASLWLRNRQPKKWRDKIDITGGQNDDGSDKPVTIFLLPDNGRG